MRASTRENHYRFFKSRLYDLYSHARTCCWTVQEIVKEKKSIIADAKAIKGFPGYCISMLLAVDDCLWSELNNEMIWLHQTSDGRLVNSYLDLSPGDKIKINNNELSSNHYYRDRFSPMIFDNVLNDKTKKFETYVIMRYRVKEPFLVKTETK